MRSELPRVFCRTSRIELLRPVTSDILTDMKSVIQVDSNILGGTPVFHGTRVPIQNLFDYIEGDEIIDEFLTDFPTVTKKQVIQLLEQLKDHVAITINNES